MPDVAAYRQIVDSSFHRSSPDSPSSRHMIADADPLSSDPVVVCPALATDTRNSLEIERTQPAATGSLHIAAPITRFWFLFIVGTDLVIDPLGGTYFIHRIRLSSG
ncbi:hypothetical protein ZIOFF_006607 [Zingiber officinale]|uniref:Uncharacterized protein n=1 Tax=Zingiber officinale TaxID=94328 RepID=A0A8J5HVS0_ZINOF|nr:hypothetical protein ZIOFF_006607 [Zingiber officinale]